MKSDLVQGVNKVRFPSSSNILILGQYTPTTGLKVKGRVSLSYMKAKLSAPNSCISFFFFFLTLMNSENNWKIELLHVSFLLQESQGYINL